MAFRHNRHSHGGGLTLLGGHHELKHPGIAGDSISWEDGVHEDDR